MAIETVAILSPGDMGHAVGQLLRENELRVVTCLAGRSQRGGMWGGDPSKTALAKAMVLKGDIAGAADRIMEAVDAQSRQASQYGGLAGMFAAFNTGQNFFEPFVSLFVLRPELLDNVRGRLLQAYEAKPDDPVAAKRLMQLHRRMGRPDLAEAILERMSAKGVTDQSLVARLIDRAIKKREYAKAIEMARAWIDRQGLSEGGAWGATAQVAERPQVDFLFPTMVAMADAVEAEQLS